MRRRDFIGLLSGAVAAWPLTALAQPSTVPILGFLHPGAPETTASNLAAFRQGLGETGFT
jgi:putative tryptophan/tyrosine transport system substrate-binding protein